MRSASLEIFVELIRYDFFTRKNDFAALHAKVCSFPVTDQLFAPTTTELICSAVDRACIWYFKEVKCLQRSSVTAVLLRRRGVPAKMIIGVQRLPLKAHAWVEVEGRVANDKSSVQMDYVVMERC